MRIIRKIALFTLIAAFGGICLGLVGFPAERVYAKEYNISEGNIVINVINGYNPGGQQCVNGEMDSTPVITGVSPINGIQIQTISSNTVYIKLSGITINSSASRSNPAIRITGDGNAEIEFVGHNTLQSDNGHAGIQKENRGYLKMGGTGSLNVTGGMQGAGIGGGYAKVGENITITGGTVTATGGTKGAGIGGGYLGAGKNITITGGTVTATGGMYGAGIGGGCDEAGTNIEIKESAKVMAAGGISDGGVYESGAAIGDGGHDNGSSGAELTLDTSGLYDTGFIKYYTAGTSASDINSGRAVHIKYIRGAIITSKTITFDANGGNCTTQTATTVSSNGSQVLTSLPEAVRDNYNFDGWFTTASGGDKITTAYAFSSDMTVYAHWTYIPPTPRTYTITFDPNGGSVSPKSKTTGTDGKLASLPTPTREGYSFNGWFTAKDGGDQVTTSTVFGSDTTVYAHWKETPEPDPDPKPDPKPDTPKETPIMVSDNKPMNVSTEPKGDFRITYAHDIPFYGKGKVTPDYFGGITVSYNNTEYKVSAIKVNKKKHYMQITALEGNDKKLNKAVKKATKGKKKGLTFKTNPFYIRNTDKDLIVLKEKKNGDVKSVKIKINGKYYKAKKGKEWKYDKDTKTVTFLGDNLDGGYTKP